MINKKMLVLIAAGALVSLEYASVAQTNSPMPQPGGTMSQPGGSMSQPGGSMTQPGGSMTQPSQATLSDLDKEFMTQAAQGGMAEVKLGQLAAQRAVSKQVKQYAQDMIKEHTQANNELMTIAARKGVTLPTDVNAEQKALRTRLGQIPGQRFDQVYMSEAGVKSHAQQAALFRREAQQGQDPDVKAFAAKVLPTVEEHLQMARAMSSTAGANQNHEHSTSNSMR